MNNKIKMIALFGPGGSGKDSLLNHIVNKYPNQFHKVISYTTRAKRDYEVDGEDYFFIDAADFGQRVIDGDMMEATTWDEQFYGTGYSALNPDKINVAVLNTEGIECLIDDRRIQLYPIFIAVEEKTRLLRMLNRESNPDIQKICRRIIQDADTFNKEFDFDFWTYYNGDGVSLDEFQERLDAHGLLSNLD